MKEVYVKTAVLEVTPEEEYKRVLELSTYDLDISVLRGTMYDLAELAAKTLGAEAACIQIVDTYTIRPISCFGISRENSFKQQSIEQFTLTKGGLLEIPDLLMDNRTKGIDTVRQFNRFRYYCGLPLTAESGTHIGTISVLHKHELELSENQKYVFQLLANQVVEKINVYKQTQELLSKLDNEKTKKRRLNHDIRGPLGGILGLVDICREQEQEKKASDILKMLDMIKKSGNSLLEITNGILPEKAAPMGDLMPTEIHLSKLKAKLETQFKPLAAAKQISLTITGLLHNESYAFSQRTVLQVAENLIANALHISPEHGIVTVELECKPTSRNGYLHITLTTDTHTRLSASEGEMLQQCNGSTGSCWKQNQRIFGYILTKHWVDEMGGTMEVKNKDGNGLNIEIQIPLIK